MVLAQILQDNAFANALENSDEENIKIECDAAIRRAVLAVDDVELTKAYFDVSAFHNRLHKEVLAQATEQAALTPKQLYEAALPELIGLIEQSEIYLSCVTGIQMCWMPRKNFQQNWTNCCPV